MNIHKLMSCLTTKLLTILAGVAHAHEKSSSAIFGQPRVTCCLKPDASDGTLKDNECPCCGHNRCHNFSNFCHWKQLLGVETRAKNADFSVSSTHNNTTAQTSTEDRLLWLTHGQCQTEPSRCSREGEHDEHGGEEVRGRWLLPFGRNIRTFGA